MTKTTCVSTNKSNSLVSELSVIPSFYGYYVGRTITVSVSDSVIQVPYQRVSVIFDEHSEASLELNLIQNELLELNIIKCEVSSCNQPAVEYHQSVTDVCLSCLEKLIKEESESFYYEHPSYDGDDLPF